MRYLHKSPFSLVVVFLLLVLLIGNSRIKAQEKTDEELKKKYAAIIGEYEFEMESGSFFLRFYIEDGELWADSGDGRPATMQPVGDNPFEFTAEDPQTGIFDIKFRKDDAGEYTICKVANADMGLEVTGYKIKQRIPSVTFYRVQGSAH